VVLLDDRGKRDVARRTANHPVADAPSQLKDRALAPERVPPPWLRYQRQPEGGRRAFRLCAAAPGSCGTSDLERSAGRELAAKARAYQKTINTLLAKLGGADGARCEADERASRADEEHARARAEELQRLEAARAEAAELGPNPQLNRYNFLRGAPPPHPRPLARAG
jgi:hypothetical protein